MLPPTFELLLLPPALELGFARVELFPPAFEFALLPPALELPLLPFPFPPAFELLLLPPALLLPLLPPALELGLAFDELFPPALELPLLPPALLAPFPPDSVSSSESLSVDEEFDRLLVED